MMVDTFADLLCHPGVVEVYDAAADTWASLAPMSIPRHGSSAATVNGSIYIPAGGTASGTPCTDAFDVYTP